MSKITALKIGLFGCLLLVVSANAQVLDERVYDLFEVDKQPSYPGGEKEMFKFIQENLKYPAISKEQGQLPGRMGISFIVNEEGWLTEIKSLRPGTLNDSFKEIIEKMPHWLPGEKGGKAVKVRYTLPISCIKLE